MTTYEYFSQLIKTYQLLKTDISLATLISISTEIFDVGDIAVQELLHAQSAIDSNQVKYRIDEKLGKVISAIRELPLGDTILQLNRLHSQLSSYVDSLSEPVRGIAAPFATMPRDVITKYEQSS